MVDLYPGTIASNPDWIFELAPGVALFSAGLPGIGTEPCVSDGTAAGTALVLDLGTSSATAASAPGPFVAGYGHVFFAADDGINGRELWRSDGTAAGTTMIKDLTPGAAASDCASLTLFRNWLLFTLTQPGLGNELWISDGTAAGTALLKDIRPGSAGSSPSEIRVVGDHAYFSANDGTTGRELWRTDGSPAGTQRVADVNPGSPDGVALITKLGDRIYFRGNTPATGYELWLSDGTQAGTVLVKDLYPGTNGSFPTEIVAHGNLLYFAADTAATGAEIWKSDGTNAGTVLVRSGLTQSVGFPAYLTSAGPYLFFVLLDTLRLEERLWRTDGTSAGTLQLFNGSLGIGTSAFASVGAFGNLLLFQASSNTAPFYADQLFVSDGTTAGTKLLKALDPATRGRVTSFSPIGSRRCYFAGLTPAEGLELWSTDGTPAGTALVRDINPGPAQGVGGILTLANGRVFFAADDGVTGLELWTLDPGATSQSIGLPCGQALPTLSATDPVLGASMTLAGGNAPASALGVVQMGARTRTPLFLGFGCAAYFDLLGPFLALPSFAVTQPDWTSLLPVPNNAALKGGQVVFQGIFAPTGSPFGFDLTNGVRSTLGG